MCLQLQIRIKFIKKIKKLGQFLKNLEPFLSKSYIFLIQTLICIIN